MEDQRERQPLKAELVVPEPAIIVSGTAGIYDLKALPPTIDEAIELYNDLGRALAGQNAERTEGDV